MACPLIGLTAYVGKPGARKLVEAVLAEFARHRLPYLLDNDTAALLERGDGLEIPELMEQCEMLMVLGGDGSILRALRKTLGATLKPLLGINFGSLGFLTCVSAGGYDRAIQSLVEETYVISRRSLLSVAVRRNDEEVLCKRALNDVVVSRGSSSKLVKVSVSIDDEVLTEYNADGLIVATPTGSTAYSLAAGGPILMPQSDVFVITPISPHVLTNRSVIVSDSSRIVVKPTRPDQALSLSADGDDPFTIEAGDILCITKSAATLPLVMLPELPFSEVLRQKLKWSGSNV
ncbi:MAG TPA: NAD(+)/NADH kinase [Chthoniobacterales bacterium]